MIKAILELMGFRFCPKCNIRMKKKTRISRRYANGESRDRDVLICPNCKSYLLKY